jgi:hypothetical protein
VIDTVRFRQPRHMRESASRRNWNIVSVAREIISPDGWEDEQLQGVRGFHKKYGIRFFGSRDQIISVEASLPRILYGHNGKLLRSQADINAALRNLDRLLDAISHRPEGSRCFTRVDLVWHVPGSCKEFILAHQNVRHPRVRKATCIYQNESITWRGAAFNLLLYDKLQKEQGQPGDFVRVEAQLRKHMLDEFFEQSGHALDFGQCYRHLRRLVLQLEPAAMTRVSSIAELLAACIRNNCSENGVSLAESYLQARTMRRQRDLRREIASIRVESRSIDWSALLPEAPPANPPEASPPRPRAARAPILLT